MQLECTLIDASTNVTRERGYLLELLLGLALHASQHSISCFLKLDLTQYSVHPYKQPYKNFRKFALVFFSIYMIYRLILKNQELNESSYNNSQIA